MAMHPCGEKLNIPRVFFDTRWAGIQSTGEILEKVLTFIQVGNNKKFTDEILILLTQDPGTFASVNYDTHHGWCSSSLEHSNNSLDIQTNPPNISKPSKTNPPNPK